MRAAAAGNRKGFTRQDCARIKTKHRAVRADAKHACNGGQAADMRALSGILAQLRLLSGRRALLLTRYRVAV